MMSSYLILILVVERRLEVVYRVRLHNGLEMAVFEFEIGVIVGKYSILSDTIWKQRGERRTSFRAEQLTSVSAVARPHNTTRLVPRR
jgi:hypothetical protein